ncbi:MAG: hypothetical protein ABR915_09470 [Thermoguttaceae bacterium]
MNVAESQPTVPRHGVKLRNIVLAIIAAFILLLVFVSIPIVQWIHYHKTFPVRHLEATQFIEVVYGYYADKGKWPDAATAIGLSSLPAKWEYFEKTDPADPKTTPMILLNGEYHLHLAYYFSPPDGKTISGEWRGESKMPFQADVTYRATSSRRP